MILIFTILVVVNDTVSPRNAIAYYKAQKTVRCTKASSSARTISSYLCACVCDVWINGHDDKLAT